MNLEEQVMEVREKQAYWKGVVAGVIGSGVFFSGLVAFLLGACRFGLLHGSNCAGY